MEKLIEYIDTLEKANNMITSLDYPKEFENHIKDIKNITFKISAIISYYDEKYRKEFYGEEVE